MSGSELPWGGALAALGMTLGVVALAFVGVGGMQDPDRPLPPKSQERLAAKKAAVLQERAPACGLANVQLVAAIHGPDGGSDTHAADHDLTAWMAVINPCPTPLTFTTPTLCLFDGFELLQEGQPPRPAGTMCGQMVTEWSLAAGAAERWSWTLGNLPAGDYQVAARFGPSEGRASADFTVR